MVTNVDVTRPLDCGHMTTPGRISAGYACGATGTMCYACAAEVDRAAMRDGRPIVAYLSGDGTAVTTWAGVPLAQVVRECSARTGFSGSWITYIRAVDVDGRRYYARNGGRGMVLTFRPCATRNGGK